MMPTLDLVRLADRPDLSPAVNELMNAAWPRFMMEDPVSNRLWPRLRTTFPSFQLALLAGEDLVCVGNAVAFHWPVPANPAQDGLPDPLPDTGWDWVMERAFQDADAGLPATLASALAISIPPAHRGRGFARVMLGAFKAAAAAAGCRALVAPVRPTRKAERPELSMADYLAQRDPQGRRFDPWVGLHESLGACILGICYNSMTIPGSRADWQNWTGLEAPASGPWVVPDALVPVWVEGESAT
ncbi:MAG: GNAT family N-acetyltransferase, partial [Alphaproteobacteria bacterium]